MKDSFKARTTLACGNQNFEIFSLAALKVRNDARLPDLKPSGSVEGMALG